MTVSISNMAQVWMSNSNVYNAISMSVSTMGYGANTNSRIIKFKVDGNTKFDVDANGNIYTPTSISANLVASNTSTSNNITANTITANTLRANVITSNIISANAITANTLTANTITTKNLVFTTVTVANLPSAAGVGAGVKAFVTDSNQNSFFANVATGGTNAVPVFSDGTRWKIG